MNKIAIEWLVIGKEVDKRNRKPECVYRSCGFRLSQGLEHFCFRFSLSLSWAFHIYCCLPNQWGSGRWCYEALLVLTWYEISYQPLPGENVWWPCILRMVTFDPVNVFICFGTSPKEMWLNDCVWWDHSQYIQFSLSWAFTNCIQQLQRSFLTALAKYIFTPT